MKHFRIEFRCPSSAPLIGGWSSTPVGAHAGTAIDNAGYPTIPATALRGALRETLEALLRANDGTSMKVLVCGGGDGVDPRENREDPPRPRPCLLDDGGPCVVCRLFGSPNHLPMLLLGDGKYGRSTNGRPATSLRNGVAIDRSTRTAKNDLLFTYELTTPGAEHVFSAEGQLRELDSEKLLESLKLLKAACSATKHIGRGRSRGFGRVDVQLIEVPDPPPSAASLSPSTTSVRFLAKLLTPASVAFFPAAAFVRDTRDDIPGSTIRGAFGFALADAGLDRDPGFNELFEASTRATFDFAYPVDDLISADAAGPWPLTARRCKISPNHPVFDTLLDQIAVRLAGGQSHQPELLSRRLPAQCPQRNCGAPTERPDGFRRLEGPIGRRVITRVAIDRTTSSARHEALYSQVLLDSGTCFEGTIRNISPNAVKLLEKGLSLPLSFGRGRARGWGQASFIQIRDGDGTTLSSLASRAENFGNHLAKRLIDLGLDELAKRARSLVPITLLSPLLLAPGNRDDDGAGVLSRAIGIPNPQWLHKAARFGFEAGWDARAGSAGAIPAVDSTVGGSVFVLDLGERDWTELLPALTRLESHGVGERTHQGFGRVLCFDPFIGRKA